MPKSQQKLFRFFRSNLPTIVWDPDKNRAIVEFVEAQYYTEDEKIAQMLIDKGYPQIPLDLEEPPDVWFKRGRSLADGENVPVMAKNITEDVAADKERRDAEQKRLREKAAQGSAPVVDEEKPMIETVTQSPADATLAQREDAAASKTKTKVSKAKPKRKAAKTAAKKAPRRSIMRRSKTTKKE